MIAINTIDHINIKINDLNESIQFYQNVFGFEVKEREVSQMSGNEYAIVGLSSKLFIVLCQDKSDLSESRLNHFGINVVDFDNSLKVIEKLGVPVNEYGIPGGVINYPKSRSIYIQDPDGNEIELSSNFGGGL